MLWDILIHVKTTQEQQPMDSFDDADREYIATFDRYTDDEVKQWVADRKQKDIELEEWLAHMNVLDEMNEARRRADGVYELLNEPVCTDYHDEAVDFLVSDE